MRDPPKVLLLAFVKKKGSSRKNTGTIWWIGGAAIQSCPRHEISTASPALLRKSSQTIFFFRKGLQNDTKHARKTIPDTCSSWQTWPSSTSSSLPWLPFLLHSNPRQYRDFQKRQEHHENHIPLSTEPKGVLYVAYLVEPRDAVFGTDSSPRGSAE